MAAAILLNADATVRTQALPGKTAGTEQWIVEFRSRGFDLRQKLAEARGMPTQAERRQKLAELRQLAALDQAAFAADLQGVGGAVRRHLWVVNALVADIPTARLDWARVHPRVRRLWPNEARGLGSAGEGTAPCAIAGDDGNGTDQYNHNVAAAWAVPSQSGRTKGEGVTIAFFDTGLDRHWQANTGIHTVYELAPVASPHVAFHVDSGQPPFNELTLVDPATGQKTRLWESFAASVEDLVVEDVNDHWPASLASGGRHGTAVAGIAAGLPIPNATPQVPAGHATRAFIVGWSIMGTGNCFTNGRWVATASHYLAAIEDLRYWLTLRPEHRAHVLNISVDGWPDPEHPVSFALDALSSDDTTDTLVVVLAGNEGDASLVSHGGWHALSVGSVHERADPAQPYYPMADTSRGPLASDRERPFPDACATGAGDPTEKYYSGTWPNLVPGSLLAMPMADQSAGAFQSRGTSMAAPQVSGAAALYRARRLNAVPPADALETKAALLLNVDDPFSKLTVETTYANRNTFGVGYTRDDWLVEYAERLPAMRPLGQRVTIGATATQQTLTYTVAAGQRHAVVAAWFRPAHLSADIQLPNVDLEVLQGTAVIASSKTTKSSFERAVFTAAGVGGVAVTLRLTVPEMPGYDVGVYVAGRELPATLQTTAPLARAGQVVETPQVAGCAGTGVTHAIRRTIPVSYTNAYGSYPVFGSALGNSGASPGFDGWRVNNTFNTVYLTSEVGGDFDAAGLAFRSWRPFVGGSITITQVWLYETSDSPKNIVDPGPWGGGMPQGNVFNVQAMLNTQKTVTARTTGWSAADWDTWSIVVPFDWVYAYRGSGLGRHLGVYCVFGLPSAAEVDWITDGPAPQCPGAVDPYATRLPGQSAMLGTAPVLGLIESASPATLPPVLRLIGEPRVTAPGASVPELLLFRLEQVPAQGLGVLNSGTDLVNLPGPSGCAILVGNAVPVEINFPISSPWTLVDVDVPVDPTLLWSDVHWQTVLTGGGVTSLSNALTTRLGGLHQ